MAQRFSLAPLARNYLTPCPSVIQILLTCPAQLVYFRHQLYCDLCLFSYPGGYYLSQYMVFNTLLSIFGFAASLLITWLLRAHGPLPYVISGSPHHLQTYVLQTGSSITLEYVPLLGESCAAVIFSFDLVDLFCLVSCITLSFKHSVSEWC